MLTDRPRRQIARSKSASDRLTVRAASITRASPRPAAHPRRRARSPSRLSRWWWGGERARKTAQIPRVFSCSGGPRPCSRARHISRRAVLASEGRGRSRRAHVILREDSAEQGRSGDGRLQHHPRTLYIAHIACPATNRKLIVRIPLSPPKVWERVILRHPKDDAGPGEGSIPTRDATLATSPVGFATGEGRERATASLPRPTSPRTEASLRTLTTVRCRPLSSCHRFALQNGALLPPRLIAPPASSIRSAFRVHASITRRDREGASSASLSPLCLTPSSNPSTPNPASRTS